MSQVYEVALPVPDKVTAVPVQTDWSFPALTFGKAFSVTFTIADVPVQPLAFVTITEYAPAVVTFIVCVFPEGDQTKFVYPEPASSVIELPVQNAVGPVITGLSDDETVTITWSVLEHPLTSVPVTV